MDLQCKTAEPFQVWLNPKKAKLEGDTLTWEDLNGETQTIQFVDMPEGAIEDLKSALDRDEDLIGFLFHPSPK